MDDKSKILVTDINDQIKYWKWINDYTLGIVGNKSVYHVNI